MAVNVLVSYGVLPTVDITALRASLRCGRVLLDSGAFTAHASGRTIRVGEYAAYLERWRGSWDHAITLDVIGDAAASARNTTRLHARGLPVMPVFTLGARLAEFDAMVRDCGYVAVGGMVGASTSAATARVRMLQARARAAGGGVHALGMGSTVAIAAARPYSADASTPSFAYKMGKLNYFDGMHIRRAAVRSPSSVGAAASHLAAQGASIGPVIRAGRMPTGPDGRRLRVASLLSFACADEALRRGGVPSPRGAEGTGTVLFIALARGSDPSLAAELDALIHSGGAPQAWRRYGHRECAARVRR